MVNNFSCDISLTNEQRAILEGPPNIIVEGAAGTGKTMLAILLAQKLAAEDKVGVIIYTQALRSFIKDAINNDNVAVFNAKWEDYLERDYDYLIVDEVQDFTLATIKKILQSNVKGIYFFGDDGQQLYQWQEKKVTIEEIKRETGFQVVALTQNMRLSIPVGRFLKSILPAFTFGQSTVNMSDIPPDVEHFEYIAEEQKYLSRLISEQMGGTIAVILSRNEQVLKYYLYLKQHVKNKPVGHKTKTANNLIFKESDSVNVLTFHSAKGLEFDHVIIPNGGHDDGEGKCMYVGCTRALYSLVITDNGNGVYPIEPSTLYNGESHKKYIRSYEINGELYEIELELVRNNILYESYSTEPVLKKECEKLKQQIAGWERKKIELNDELSRITEK